MDIKPSDPYRSRAENAVISAKSKVPFLPGRTITAEPLIDSATGLYARLTADDYKAVAKQLGGRMMTIAELDALHRGIGVRRFLLKPITLWAQGRDIRQFQWAVEHDRQLLMQLAQGPGAPYASGTWDGTCPLANAGKYFVGEPAEAGTNMGWWEPSKARYIQNPSPSGTDGNPTTLPPHGSPGNTSSHCDYSQLAMVVFDEEDMKPDQDEAVPDTQPKAKRGTVKQGDRGDDVRALQRHLGLKNDGIFGAKTGAAVEMAQRLAGLVADGVVGAKTWALWGEEWAPKPGRGGDPRAPACVAALRDANGRWPSRKKASDGIMGDAAHQARPSDHNLGNAVDITHDPAAGCDGQSIAELAMKDDRVSYIIWNRQIWSPTRAAEGWRRYTGSNPHTLHVHISVHASKRDDDKAWPWQE